jgi:hypothetical protein
MIFYSDDDRARYRAKRLPSTKGASSTSRPYEATPRVFSRYRSLLDHFACISEYGLHQSYTDHYIA